MMELSKNCGCGNFYPKFIGLLKIDWATGFSSLGFECLNCHKQGQSFEMLNLEGGFGKLFKHPECQEINRELLSLWIKP